MARSDTLRSEIARLQDKKAKLAKTIADQEKAPSGRTIYARRVINHVRLTSVGRDAWGYARSVSKGRPPPPEDVARQLRRESGFGCCECGCPVYQYHHIVPWSVEEHFRVEDMMVLCPNCHDAATKGALDERRQRRAKANPFNVQQGYASGALTMNEAFAAVGIGGYLLVGDQSGIRVDGLDLLRLDVDEDGLLLLSAHVADQEGEVLAIIDRNEWVAGDPKLWDLKSDHQKLKLWIASRKIRLEINAKKSPVWFRADLWHSGQYIRLNSTGIFIDGDTVRELSINGLGLVGIRLEIDSLEKQGKFVPYLGSGAIVTEPDPIERLRKSVNTWARLSSGGGPLHESLGPRG